MTIRYGSHTISRQDIKSIEKVLKKNFLTQGPQIKKFENKLMEKFGAKYCSAVSSGTAALHLAVKSLSLPEKSKIVTTPLTFVATSNSIIMNGYNPELVDIDSRSYTIDVNKLEYKLKKDKKIKAIIAVDYAGNICDWESLNFLKKKYNIKLLNDNCHAIGTRYKGSTKYACKFADVVTQSYHPVKAITTAEGGSVLTNNKEIFEKVNLFRNHGINRNKNLLKKKGAWFYEIKNLGYNYRLSDLQCALGISQLKNLTNFISSRRKVAKIYDKEFLNVDKLQIPLARKNCYHSYHLYPLLIDFNQIKIDKKTFFLKMQSKGIYMQVHYLPIHYHDFYKKRFKLKKGDFPIAENFYEKEVSIPIYPSLKKKEVHEVVNRIVENL
ncbi:UDP-4-amino-4,6-dideoxy-N-acetyl-beta-L-altrosamine transaminase [Candidatus Pelagibacter sp.]|nr:UDP-4-amino-4,6-dideoxy-N-acetyl-beta-L-altrosamine transaminase [Candidatus Pelagibacter sp.]